LYLDRRVGRVIEAVFIFIFFCRLNLVLALFFDPVLPKKKQDFIGLSIKLGFKKAIPLS
jgi:hypothetical protein